MENEDAAGTLHQVLAERPEACVSLLQDWIADWRFPRGKSIGDQVNRIHRLSAVAQFVADFANGWAAPLWDLEGAVEDQVKAAQAGKERTQAEARADLVASLGAELRELRDLIDEVLGEEE